MTMTEKPKHDRSKALEVARELCAVMRGVTMPDRLKVCGSLRRGKAQVGDVEIVFVPRTEMRQADLLSTMEVDLASEAVERLLAAGVIHKRPNIRGIFAWGPKNKLAVHTASGIPVDFFATTEDHWWVTVVIRTGPAKFNIRLIKEAAERDLKLHAYGAFTNAKTGQEIIPSSEQQVFELAGLDYLEPHQRTE
jgi:DNA polymerase/3'-5' exonuclease PolX